MKGKALVLKNSTPKLQELAQAALDGDRTAFDRLIALVEKDVMKTALYLTRNPADAEDVAQEVYLRLLRNLDRLTDLSGMRPWIYRVTVNAARDLQRKRRPWVPLTEWLGWVSPADPMADTELRGRLPQALGRLTFRERAAFILRDLEELPTAEVSQILGCAPATVRTHLHRAHRKLRHHLRDFRRTS